jgi:hypothetical protein
VNFPKHHVILIQVKMSKQVGAIKKYRKYSLSKLEAAVKMVERGSLFRKKAAIVYGIPRPMLIYKLSG